MQRQVILKTVAKQERLYHPDNTATERTLMLEEYRPPTKVRLAALWASTMFCYAYCDYFGLYVAGTVADMNRGILGPLGHATPAVLVGVSVMMAVPSLMVTLSLLLPARVCKWVCVVIGLAYTAIEGLTLPGSQPFYVVFGLIEMSLTLAISIIALRWPKHTIGT